jgi:syntaxin 5
MEIVAKRKTLFDDKPVEFAQLTGMIKTDLGMLNTKIAQLQTLTKSQHPQTKSGVDQEGEHNKNVGLPKKFWYISLIR